jgi:hypothetical protein
MSEQAIAASAPAVTRERRMWMTDTRSIIMLLMLGVAASAIQQISFRLDTMLTGGTGFYVGHVTIVATSFAASILFGPMGFILPVMTAAIGAFTSASPGAWYWIPDSLWIGLVTGYLAFRMNVRGDLVRRTIILAVIYAIIIVPIDYVGLYLILLNLPLAAALVASLPYIGLTFVGVPFAIGLIRAIEAAKLGI